MAKSDYEAELERRILYLETKVKHLTNDLWITREENETATAGYLEIHSNMEKIIDDRVKELTRVADELRESENQLSIRDRITEIFLTTPYDEMYGEVLQVVLGAMESPYGTFAYIDDNGDGIVPSMTGDIWDECKMPDKGIFFPRDKWGDTLWARCLIEKKSFSSNGPFKIPDGHMPIGRALATPIIHKGESIGNLMVGNKSTDYSEKDKELLESIADRIAPILYARLLNERLERERKQAEETLQESKERYKDLFNNINDLVQSVDLNGHFLQVNKKWKEILGYDEEDLVKLSIWDIIHPDCKGHCEEIFKKVISGRVVNDAEVIFVSKNGDLVTVEGNINCRFEGARVISTLAVFRDVRKRKQAEEDKKRLEAQFQQAQKMEAIATLAGGVAHEFNNALMGIMGNIELLKMNLSEDETRDKYFERMEGSGHRMSRLTDQLLAYAQGGKYQPKDLKIHDFVIETLPILQHDLRPEVRVETHFPKHISYIRVDYAQMQMVLSAILANSNEAIEDEGIIKITAGNKDLDEGFTKQHHGLKPGPYVCLTIEDDGKGMDEETRNGIFEPFFTTKFQGRGMGMAAVYGIVRIHDGWISVDSELDKGTVVRIYLPAVEAEVRKEEKPKTEPVKGTGTILVIEDEDVVLEATQAILERLGYRVMAAKTGKDAIHITETFDGQIDLALLDIRLPDMDGGKVYPFIMKARPNLKVIVFSGYAIDGPAQDILDAGAQDFIQKPFLVVALSEKLKGVLEGNNP